MTAAASRTVQEVCVTYSVVAKLGIPGMTVAALGKCGNMCLPAGHYECSLCGRSLLLTKPYLPAGLAIPVTEQLWLQLLPCAATIGAALLHMLLVLRAIMLIAKVTEYVTEVVVKVAAADMPLLGVALITDAVIPLCLVTAVELGAEVRSLVHRGVGIPVDVVRRGARKENNIVGRHFGKEGKMWII